jgi:GNAT superfamily N-acetyltransferase
MSVIDDSLDADDLDLVARMHVEALPGSLVSMIGARYARAFYRYVARSADEIVLLHRDGRALIAACIASLHPETLARRLVVHTSLALHAMLAVHRLPLRAMLASARTPSPPTRRGPEILLVFTVPAARSTGLGAQLLARCEAYLATRGHTQLLVKTRDEPGNRAIGFYERRGFERRARVISYGKPLVLFEKALTPVEAA